MHCNKKKQQQKKKNFVVIHVFDVMITSIYLK